MWRSSLSMRLGEVSKECVLEGLPVPKLPKRVSTDEFDEVQKEIYARCANVVVKIRTHLVALLDAWKVHVTKVVQYSGQCVERTKRKLCIDPKNRTLLESLLDELDASLDTIRRFPAPTSDRPTTDIDALKQMISVCPLSTRRVEQVRLRFEYDMEKMQIPLAKELDKFVRASLNKISNPATR